ncbi:hypothetical protein VTK26DRAFT_6033 [Humicola hyalothermophila]
MPTRSNDVLGGRHNADRRRVSTLQEPTKPTHNGSFPEPEDTEPRMQPGVTWRATSSLPSRSNLMTLGRPTPANPHGTRGRRNSCPSGLGCRYRIPPEREHERAWAQLNTDTSCTEVTRRLVSCCVCSPPPPIGSKPKAGFPSSMGIALHRTAARHA